MAIGDLKLGPEDIIGASGLDALFQDWVGLAALALVTSSFILAFMWAWAQMFRDTRMEAYVKQEIYEVFVSALLVIFITMGVGAMSGLTIGSILPSNLHPEGVPSDTNLYTATGDYYTQVGEDLESWINMNYILSMFIDTFASVTPYARPLGVGLVASPLAGLASPLKQLIYNMTVSLAVAYIINYAQLAVYVFSLQAFLRFYFPLGVFFRCFTPTRRLGGTLIGIGTAFLLIFPFLTIMAYGMLYGPNTMLISFRQMLGFYIGDVSQGSILGIFQNLFAENLTGSFFDLVAAGFGGIGTLVERFVGGVFLTIIMIPIATIAWAFALGFIVPTFNVMLFTQAAKSLSLSFGEEVDVSALTRLI